MNDQSVTSDALSLSKCEQLPVTSEDGTEQLLNENNPHPSSLIPHPLKIPHPSEDDVWDEAKLANLLGFEGEIQSEENAHPSSFLPHPLETPSENLTEPTLASSPWAKAGLVGGIMGIAFVVTGVVLTQISGSDFSVSMAKSSVDNNAENNEKEEEMPDSTGLLKTELALASQESQLKNLEASPTTEENTTELKETETPENQTKTDKLEQKTPEVKNPPPTRNSETRELPPPMPTPVVRTTTPPPPVFNSPPTFNSPASNLKPEVQWAYLANLGSYGSVTSDQLPVTNTVTSEQRRTEPVEVLPVTSENSSSLIPHPSSLNTSLIPHPSSLNTSLIPHPSSLNTSLKLRQEEEYILQEIPAPRRSFQIQVGQRVTAHLATPIIAMETSNNDQSPERFVVVLDQPLRDAQGQIVLSAQSTIIFELSGIGPSGLVESEAIAVIRGGMESPLPKGVLKLRGGNGEPLLARQRSDVSGEIARRDALLFSLGALGKVGEVLNRPETNSSTVSTNGTFSQSSSSSTGEPNILGAVLEGGFNPLAEQIAQRNQSEIESFLERPPLWYVSESQQVQIFVNSSFVFSY
jgi:hypothetical protein